MSVSVCTLYVCMCVCLCGCGWVYVQCMCVWGCVSVCYLLLGGGHIPFPPPTSHKCVCLYM